MGDPKKCRRIRKTAQCEFESSENENKSKEYGAVTKFLKKGVADPAVNDERTDSVPRHEKKTSSGLSSESKKKMSRLKIRGGQRVFPAGPTLSTVKARSQSWTEGNLHQQGGGSVVELTRWVHVEKGKGGISGTRARKTDVWKNQFILSRGKRGNCVG